ncbi:hypothetical protein BDN70DRAFT_996063 [Pholiota conissans]|uniref:HIT-type domain-containing protein n=1 Tax=Pholiota conissans TaxID=109636 RepID=A0A9P5YVK2_9AGAR|nr:hypothetical protein BDN70DRAFT_996063 [Pholiota conissans]
MAARLHPSLPPNPTLKPEAQPTYAHNAEQPEASSSISSTPLCAMCVHQCAKYTCPGCAMRTCSAPCSSAHKTKTGCSGERNKVEYVPMNQYTWGKMMDDYVFLEDLGRKVGEWGTEIVKGGYMAGNVSAQNRGGARGRGRGTRGRGGGGNSGAGKTKRDILKTQLQMRDIDMELLPVGMERRKANQSTWDFKNQTALLTIEFKFYKPKDPLAPSSQPAELPFVLITHRNNIANSVMSLLRSHIHDQTSSKKDSLLPEWVKHMVYPAPEDPEAFSNPQCIMAAQLDPITLRNMRLKKASYSLDPGQSLNAVLRHMEFVEYPTIEVWEEYTGTIVDIQGIMQQREDEGAPKRRKLNPKVGKAILGGLLGGYGSDDEDEQPEVPNALMNLGEYAGSDEDDERTSASQTKGEGIELQGVDVDLDGLSDDDDKDIDPAVLLELLKAAGGRKIALEDDEDLVDWDDGTGAE